RDAAFDAGTHLSFATAQDIGAAHTVLGGFATSVAARTVILNAIDSGAWDNFGDHFAGQESFVVGQNFPGFVSNDYFLFYLTAIDQEVTSAQLTLATREVLYSSTDPSETLNFSDVSTTLTQQEGTGFGSAFVDVFNDLGSGTSFGTTTVTPDATAVTTTLNADGVTALTASEGSQFAVGGSLSSISGPDQQLLFGGSGQPDDVRQLTLTLAQTAAW